MTLRMTIGALVLAFVLPFSASAAVLVVYPDSKPESTSTDGSVARINQDESWSSIRDGEGNLANDAAEPDPIVAQISESGTIGNWKHFTRGLFLFDTSALPDSAIITSATFSLKRYSEVEFRNDYDVSVVLTSTDSAATTSLTESDYGTFGSVRYANDVPLSSMTYGPYIDWELNTAGRAAISTTGITKFGTLTDLDFDNAEPESFGTDAYSSFLRVHSADSEGTENDPMLVIEYEVPPLELASEADSFLRSGQPNRNEGANPHLTIQASGSNRPVVAFDEDAIEEYVEDNGITSATLVFTISDNGNNWGTSGRTIDAHPLTVGFAEGNGKQQGVPLLQQTRGTGPGTTWECATDTAIQNILTNCSTQWNGGTYDAATAPSSLITNGLSGTVSFDVTDDVLNGTTGWLLRKTNEGQAGAVDFYSREGAAAASNPALSPKLILTP